MRFVAWVISALVVVALAQGAMAETPKEVTWEDLAPEIEISFTNPFENLREDQLEGLRAVLRNEALAEMGAGEEAEQRALEERARLNAQGIDVDDLFAQRQAIMQMYAEAAAATNPDIVGQDVRMPGYLLPLEVKDRKAVEFLLVPTVGACIHTPAPPANQVVHIVYPQGIEVIGLYTPVWISGTMVESRTTQTVIYYDGKALVDVSYKMTPDLVEPYR